jgi:hypothetical protein
MFTPECIFSGVSFFALEYALHFGVYCCSVNGDYDSLFAKKLQMMVKIMVEKDQSNYVG